MVYELLLILFMGSVVVGVCIALVMMHQERTRGGFGPSRPNPTVPPPPCPLPPPRLTTRVVESSSVVGIIGLDLSQERVIADGLDRSPEMGVSVQYFTGQGVVSIGRGPDRWIPAAALRPEEDSWVTVEDATGRALHGRYRAEDGCVRVGTREAMRWPFVRWRTLTDAEIAGEMERPSWREVPYTRATPPRAPELDL